MANQQEEDKSERLPIKFNLIPESLTSPLIDLFPGQDEGMVRGEPGDFVFTREYGRRADEIYQHQPREDGVWVCTFSKSGATWTQELVWLIAPPEFGRGICSTRSLHQQISYGPSYTLLLRISFQPTNPRHLPTKFGKAEQIPRR